MSSPVLFSKVIVLFAFKVAVTPVASLLILSTKFDELVATVIAAPLIENVSDIVNSVLNADVNELNADAVAPCTELFRLIAFLNNFAPFVAVLAVDKLVVKSALSALFLLI